MSKGEPRKVEPWHGLKNPLRDGFKPDERAQQETIAFVAFDLGIAKAGGKFTYEDSDGFIGELNKYVDAAIALDKIGGPLWHGQDADFYITCERFADRIAAFVTERHEWPDTEITQRMAREAVFDSFYSPAKNGAVRALIDEDQRQKELDGLWESLNGIEWGGQEWQLVTDMFARLGFPEFDGPGAGGEKGESA